MRELERRFSPEFRNRIDEVVIFPPLTKDEVRQITLQQIAKIEQRAGAAAGRTLTVTPEALEQLVTDGYSLAYGARFLKRVIEIAIKLPISQRWTEGDAFTADVRDGKVEIEVSATPAAPTRRSRRRRRSDSAAVQIGDLHPIDKAACSQAAFFVGCRLVCVRRLRRGAARSAARRLEVVALLQRRRSSRGRLRRSRPARTRRHRAARSPRPSAGTRCARNPMKWSVVPPFRYITFAPMNAAPWSAMALIVASSFDGCVVKPGTTGAISTPALTPASRSCRTARSRWSGCAVPGSSARQASSSTVGTLMQTVQPAPASMLREQSASRTTIGPLVTSPTGVRPASSASSEPARELVVPLDRLIRIGRGAERDLLARPRRLVELARAAPRRG